MLQIVTKMYFREDVPLYSTLHRAVLYSNCHFLREDVIDLPVGELAPSTEHAPVSMVTLSVTEHLEAEYPDGEKSHHVATGGTDLIDDIADVLSFGLNAIFTRNRDLAKRLVPTSLDAVRPAAGSMHFRGTFDPARYVPEEELEEMRSFMTKLIALERPHFEAAMRAIRRIVRATHRALDDPTLAYVDFVAALESLSEGTDPPASTWDQMEGRKRGLIDNALDAAPPEVAERVRQAVIEAERLGFMRRFVTFVLEHLSPDYFRAGAVGALRPIRGADLERALKQAYLVRSLNVHELTDLPPEAWVLGDQADTVVPPNLGTMLSLEGMSRLSRHVVRNYVDRAPAGVDPSFNWRASLPGLLRMQTAPQYWIWMGDGFDPGSAGRYFSGFTGHLIDTLAGRNDGVPDMSAVLERIEHLLPGTADGPAKRHMVAIYALWHRRLAPGDHRPKAEAVLSAHGHLLEQPGLTAFVVGLLSNESPEWTEDQWYELAIERREQRTRRVHLELPPSVDAALQALAAEHLMKAERVEDAKTLARFAVEEVPGHEPLMAWETGLGVGGDLELDLRSLVLQVEPDSEPEEQAATTD